MSRALKIVVSFALAIGLVGVLPTRASAEERPAGVVADAEGAACAAPAPAEEAGLLDPILGVINGIVPFVTGLLSGILDLLRGLPSLLPTVPAPVGGADCVSAPAN